MVLDHAPPWLPNTDSEKKSHLASSTIPTSFLARSPASIFFFFFNIFVTSIASSVKACLLLFRCETVGKNYPFTSMLLAITTKASAAHARIKH